MKQPGPTEMKCVYAENSNWRSQEGEGGTWNKEVKTLPEIKIHSNFSSKLVGTVNRKSYINILK